MNSSSRNDLRQLASMNGEYVVSIYLPALVGAEQHTNPVRFKSLLRTAAKQMRARGIGEPAIQKMTVSAQTLLNRDALWKDLAHGLAVFVSRDALHVLPLPFRCDEACVVSRWSYLLPLVTAESDDATYFVLAVSHNAVRLLHGSRYRLEELILPELPADLASALHYDVRQGTLQMHSGQPRLAGKEGVVYHGQGGEVDVAKQELASYFREIDRAVSQYLQLRSEPLIFAGVDYLFPIYRDASHCANLVPTPLTGNPELLDAAELRARAWPLVEAHLRDRRAARAEKLWNSATRDRRINRIVEIMSAAEEGAVETLFIASGTRRMGHYMPEAAAVRYDGVSQADTDELVNEAAVFVLRTGGIVVPLEPERVPEGGVMAAVLRYPHTPIILSAASSENARTTN